ncbi:hypothetical protein DFJ58DRAFT_722085 [Suillus subalutaceus]|uniref:uncharacterized protein n=1 Tax=Suillus subalutaceus TaxID=48586 RepID=UPI001B87731C|nr:uncharacterized protein DFJ58DRAFT_722085 [Suillus subalutaceus]KAG1872921.1 hypothetical protein DFJ58DRAFT_722085 [Suillus subalutaceus]
MYEFQGQPQRHPSGAPTPVNACDYQQPVGETYQPHISPLNIGNQALPQLPQRDDLFNPAPQFGTGSMQQGAGRAYQDLSQLNNTPGLRSSSPQHLPQDIHQPSPTPNPYFGAHQPPPQGETPYHHSSSHHHFAGGSGSKASSWAPSVIPGSDEYQAMLLYSTARQPAHLLHMSQNMYQRPATDLQDQSANFNTTVAHLVAEVKRLTEHAQHTERQLDAANECIQKLEDIVELSSKMKTQRQSKNVSNDHPALKPIIHMQFFEFCGVDWSGKKTKRQGNYRCESDQVRCKVHAFVGEDKT